MKLFEDSDRYDYPLTPNSVVIDAGGYEGNFAKIIAEKYDCVVHVFEPIPRFATQIRQRVSHLPKVQVYDGGIGGYSREGEFHVQGDSTGLFAGASEIVHAPILSILNVLMEWDDFANHCDLLKLNVEGAEFEILDVLTMPANYNVITKVKNIQVQFHPIVPNCEARYEELKAALLRTHNLTYCAPWCWENYQAK